MKLRFAFLANAADTTKDGRFFVMGGGFDVLIAPKTPIGMYALAVVAQVAFSRDESGREYGVRMSISDPNGSDMGVDTIATVSPESPPVTEDIPLTVNICYNVYNVEFKMTGAYTLGFSVDDKPIGEHRFWIVSRRTDETPGG